MNSESTEPPRGQIGDTPLAWLMSDPKASALVTQLSRQLADLRRADAKGGIPPVLTLSQEDIRYARTAWNKAIRLGESRLYSLATVIAWRLLKTRQLELVGRVYASSRHESERRRFVIEETLTRDDLTRHADHALATRLARRYRYRPGPSSPFGKLYVRASFLDLRPLEAVDEPLATRVMTRVKVDDQIWNKVCDSLFDIDQIVRRNKILNAQSKYIKDVFGIKVLTPSKMASYRADEVLTPLRLDDAELGELDLALSCGRDVELVEQKDYLGLPEGERKQTGWEAIKNVYRWEGQVFELQIQTEGNYFLESSDLSDTSHRTFEMRRSALRAELDEQVPFYREFRALLKVLFRYGRVRRGTTLPSWLRIKT